MNKRPEAFFGDHSDPLSSYQREAGSREGPANRYGRRDTLPDVMLAAHFVGRGLVLVAVELRRIATALERKEVP